MATRYQYECPECGNTLPVGSVEKKFVGSQGEIRAALVVECANRAHKDPIQMQRVGFTPQRREVRSEW